MEKLFAIGYKLRYAETSDYGTEYIQASSKEQALQRFAKARNIKTTKFKTIEKWCWEEGVWSAEFNNIKQVKELTCPHCNGAGVIHFRN